MKLRTLLLLPVLLIPQPALAGGEPDRATELTVIRSEARDPLKLVWGEGEGFSVEFTRQMPTPGWTFTVDAVDIREDRIVAKITDKRPSGMVPQMIAPGTVKIPLGKIERGRWVLEIRSRRDPNKEHVPVFATALLAR